MFTSALLKKQSVDQVIIGGSSLSFKCMYVCMYVCLCMYVCMSVYVRLCVYVYVCECACVSVCLYDI